MNDIAALNDDVVYITGFVEAGGGSSGSPIYYVGSGNDAKRDMFIGRYDDVSSFTRTSIAKFDIAGLDKEDVGKALAIDSSGDIYVVGETTVTGASADRKHLFVAKCTYNSGTGVISLASVTSPSINPYLYPPAATQPDTDIAAADIVIDGSDNIYVVGTAPEVNDGNIRKMLTIRLNTNLAAGTARFGGNFATEGIKASTYSSGVYSLGTRGSDTYFVQYPNSTGQNLGTATARTWDNAGGVDVPVEILETGGYVYVAASADGTWGGGRTETRFSIGKFQFTAGSPASFSQIAESSWAAGTTESKAFGLGTDGSGSFFVGGWFDNGANGLDAAVARFNSSLTYQDSAIHDYGGLQGEDLVVSMSSNGTQVFLLGQTDQYPTSFMAGFEMSDLTGGTVDGAEWSEGWTPTTSANASTCNSSYAFSLGTYNQDNISYGSPPPPNKNVRRPSVAKYGPTGPVR